MLYNLQDFNKIKEWIRWIYEIRNVHNGMAYIWSSMDIRKRIYTHVNLLKKRNGYKKLFQYDFDKYWITWFSLKILAVYDEHIEDSVIRSDEYDLISSYDYSKIYNTDCRELHFSIKLHKYSKFLIECLNNREDIIGFLKKRHER